MLAAHALIEFGTQAQKQELLPKIRSGEHIWCQLFSEPDAGSDLASLRTRAVPDGDGFLVTGQKIWSTDAQWADMGVLLARTDPTERHAGITAFVVPMDLPGMEIRPIREMTGLAEFCEVFFDEVRLGPEHVLGEVNGGWNGRHLGPGLGAGVRRRQRHPAPRCCSPISSSWPAWPASPMARWPSSTRTCSGTSPWPGPGSRRSSSSCATPSTASSVDEEHPSDGPVGKLAYTEMNIELCELAMRDHLVVGVDRRERARGGRALAPQLPLEPGADHLRRSVGDHARPDRSPAPGASASMSTVPNTADDHAEIRNLLARYCLLLDLDDMDGWIGLFTDDGVYEVYGPGVRARRHAEAADRRTGRVPPRRPAGHRPRRRPGHDHAEPPVRRPHHRRAAPAVYDDELVRTADGWRIARCRCRFHGPDGLADRPPR